MRLDERHVGAREKTHKTGALGESTHACTHVDALVGADVVADERLEVGPAAGAEGQAAPHSARLPNLVLNNDD